MVSEPRQMTCDDVDELAGAFALDALERDELNAVEAHLNACAEPHEALWQAHRTASALAALSPPARAPEALRERLLAAVAADVDATAVAAPEVQEGASVEPPNTTLRRSAVGVVPIALAASFALLAVGLGAWALSLRNDVQYERSQSEGSRAVLTAITTPGSAVQIAPAGALPTALLVQPKDGSGAMLLINWPRAAQGKIYQAWTIAPGQKPASAGIFDGSGDEPEVVTLTRAVGSAEGFAVTVEPAGGSDQPSTQPVLLRPPPS